MGKMVPSPKSPKFFTPPFTQQNPLHFCTLEKSPSQKERIVFQPSFFRGYPLVNEHSWLEYPRFHQKKPCSGSILNFGGVFTTTSFYTRLDRFKGLPWRWNIHPSKICWFPRISKMGNQRKKWSHTKKKMWEIRGNIWWWWCCFCFLFYFFCHRLGWKIKNHSLKRF